MSALAEEAMRRGLGDVVANLVPTSKNQPARDFLQSMGAIVDRQTLPGGRTARSEATACSYRAGIPVPKNAAGESSRSQTARLPGHCAASVDACASA